MDFAIAGAWASVSVALAALGFSAYTHWYVRRRQPTLRAISTFVQSNRAGNEVLISGLGVYNDGARLFAADEILLDGSDGNEWQQLSIDDVFSSVSATATASIPLPLIVEPFSILVFGFAVHHPGGLSLDYECFRLRLLLEGKVVFDEQLTPH